MWLWMSNEPYRMCSYIFIGLYLLRMCCLQMQILLVYMDVCRAGDFYFSFFQRIVPPDPHTPGVGPPPFPWVYFYGHPCLSTAKLCASFWQNDLVSVNFVFRIQYFWDSFFVLINIYAFWKNLPLFIFFRVLCFCISKKIFTCTLFSCPILRQLSCLFVI